MVMMIMRMVLNNILTINTNNKSKNTNNNIREVWPPDCRNVFQAISTLSSRERANEEIMCDRVILLRTA